MFLCLFLSFFFLLSLFSHLYASPFPPPCLGSRKKSWSMESQASENGSQTSSGVTDDYSSWYIEEPLGAEEVQPEG